MKEQSIQDPTEERARLALLIAFYSRRDGVYTGINRLCSDLSDKLKSILEDAQARLSKELTEFEGHINKIPEVIRETTVKIAFNNDHLMCSFTKKFPMRDLHFCCRELREAASIEGEAEISLLLESYEADMHGERWYGRCPYCKALLVLNRSGLFPTWRDEI